MVSNRDQFWARCYSVFTLIKYLMFLNGKNFIITLLFADDANLFYSTENYKELIVVNTEIGK